MAAMQGADQHFHMQTRGTEQVTFQTQDAGSTHETQPHTSHWV